MVVGGEWFPWDNVLAWAPEVLVVMPCGFGIAKAFEEAQRLLNYPGWSQIPAVLSGQVYVADANAYFARPGPRVVDGTELLAHLIHPDLFACGCLPPPGGGEGWAGLTSGRKVSP